MTDAGASGFVAAISAVLLQAIGVDAYTITMACIGAVIFQASATHVIGRAKAMMQVGAGGVIGAVAAQSAADYFGLESRALLMFTAAFAGYAYFKIFDSLTNHTEIIIKSIADRLGKK